MNERKIEKELNKEIFCCKGKRLANYLLDHHCKLIRIDCDKEAKGYLVFIFIKNRNLNDALQSWKVDKESYLF